MTATALKRNWPRYDAAVLSAIVLLQAGVLVWLGDVWSVRTAAIVLIGGVAACLAIPTVFTEARARVHSLFSALHWWHWAWALLFFSDFVFRERSAQSIEDNPLDIWALYRVALVGMVGAALVWRYLTRRGDWVRSLFSGLVLVMAAFPLAGLVSAIWSVYPAWTAYKSVEFLIDVSVLAAALAAIHSPAGLKSLFDWTWLLFAGLQGSVWISALVVPERALFKPVGVIRWQLSGVFPDLAANGVGHLAAILSVVALARLLARGAQNKSTFLYWLMLLASLATLILSQTRSALTGFMLGAALVLLLSGRAALVLATGCVALLVLALTSAESTFLEYFQRGQSAELFGSLSGRTTWWSFAWERFLERPFTGFGAFAGGRFAALVEMGDQITSSVHNTYLEAILGLGILGIVPLTICLLGTWWRLIKIFASRTADVLERNLGLEAVGVLTVITVRSFFTTDLIWHPSLPWLLMLGLAESLRRQGREIPKRLATA